MKRVLILLILGILLSGAFFCFEDSIACLNSPIDNTSSRLVNESVLDAIKKGYVPECLQNNYQLPITREEFAQLLVTAVFSDCNTKVKSYDKAVVNSWGFRHLTVDNFLSKVSTSFEFMDTKNKYVKTANLLGMVNGIGNSRFDPKGLMTREQAAVMCVNYLQTVYTPFNIEEAKDIGDLNTVSSWAKEAVEWAYGAGFINVTIERKMDAKGELIERINCKPKEILTREQAIEIVNKLGDKHLLHHLILRGYLQIDLDTLMCHFEINGNTIKLPNSGYDSEYSNIKIEMRNIVEFQSYVHKYTTVQLYSVFLMPIGADMNMTDPYHMNRVLSGVTTLYDYGAFTIEHNKEGYLSIITKNEDYGYMYGSYPNLFVYKNGTSERIIGKEVK